jgi:tRNA uridine 5-carbamoylmethylation protein Kti12
MDTKLTIKLDKYVIDKAKDYASSHKKSLSRLIESYLKSLVIQDNSNDNEEIRISPFVKSISSGVSIPAELDYKKDYADYLIEKYK